MTLDEARKKLGDWNGAAYVEALEGFICGVIDAKNLSFDESVRITMAIADEARRRMYPLQPQPTPPVPSETPPVVVRSVAFCAGCGHPDPVHTDGGFCQDCKLVIHSGRDVPQCYEFVPPAQAISKMETTREVPASATKEGRSAFCSMADAVGPLPTSILAGKSPPTAEPPGEPSDDRLTTAEEAALEAVVREATQRKPILIGEWRIAYDAYRLGKEAGRRSRDAEIEHSAEAARILRACGPVPPAMAQLNEENWNDWEAWRKADESRLAELEKRE